MTEDDLELFKTVPEDFRRITNRRGQTFNWHEAEIILQALKHYKPGTLKRDVKKAQAHASAKRKFVEMCRSFAVNS